MATRLTLDQWRVSEGLEDEDDYIERLQAITFDGICPPLCDTCGDVEPDGHCSHGFPSIMLEAGLI